MSEPQRQADRSVRQLHPLRAVLCGLPGHQVGRAIYRAGGPGQALPLSGRFAGRPPDETLFSRKTRPTGMWGCHTIMKCGEVCPKNVRPTDGIRGLRRKLLVAEVETGSGGGNSHET